MVNLLSNIFIGLGCVVFVISSLCGSFLSLLLVSHETGFWGFIIAFMFFPVTFIAAPFYALFKYGSWFILIVGFGGWIIGALFYGVGTLIRYNIILSLIVIALLGIGIYKSLPLIEHSFYFNNHSEQQGSDISKQPLNSYELGKISAVIAAASERPLLPTDIQNLKSAYEHYFKRTGTHLSQNEADMFLKEVNLSIDYQYELGSSLLMSWDNKQVITTKHFDELFKVMQDEGGRKQEILNDDKSLIRYAADNSNYRKDGNGNKYHFSRELILKRLDSVEISRTNLIKVAEAIKEFVRN